MAKNPFITKGYESKELFCDREKELQVLLRNCQSGIDTTLISHRRMGKTGLVKRLFDEISIQEINITPIYVDIYATRSLEDFIRYLTEAVMKAVPSKTSFGKKFFTFIKSLRPQLSYDSISGDPQISITYQSEQEKINTLRGILEFLDKQNKHILVAFDEFQQIREYPETNVEALLRTHIQSLKNVNFIFCGSKKHLMADIFGNAKKPFYSSTAFVTLDKISEQSYAAFIRRQFSENKKEITEDAIQYIMDWTCRHTYYTQNLSHQVFAMSDTYVDTSIVRNACGQILEMNESMFLQYRQMLTERQWNYLIAMAKETEVEQPTAQAFLSKYNIGSAATSKRLLQSLIEKELLADNVGLSKTSYFVYDVFFMRWLEKEYL